MALRISTRALVVSLIVAGCSSGLATGPAPESTSQSNAADAQPSAAPSAESTVAAPTSSTAPSASAAAADGADAPTAEAPRPGSPGELLMRDHFKQTVTIRESLIWGKVSNAVAPAESLAGIEGVKTLPKHWQVSVTQLQEAARRIRQSSDLPEAAAATADIGRACGLCHASVRGPEVKLDAAPAMDSSVASRMRRHHWATERLWEGLYVPSNPAWAAGAAALDIDPFAGDALNKGGVHAKSAGSRFNKTAKTLAQAKTSEARGAAYSELLSTCGPCHEAMGVER
jgi:cytochrome c556